MNAVLPLSLAAAVFIIAAVLSAGLIVLLRPYILMTVAHMLVP
jgi:hypothetical protein